MHKLPKQAVMQRLRDAEREILYTEFIDKEDDILTGVIDRVDHRYVYVNLGRIEAVLSEAERSPNENIFLTNVLKSMLIKWNRQLRDHKFTFLEVIQAC